MGGTWFGGDFEGRSTAVSCVCVRLKLSTSEAGGGMPASVQLQGGVESQDPILPSLGTNQVAIRLR
jgi:hypothetical protein